ncbi:uncharacterized protein LOC129602943 [Betta splendens]|uniref:Uncharacterized protein LOC129602943 n=1 Tax=Betta splendens TaxID=158456 RepID=A0A9W2Y8D6_BETSP|nr:uncharacterized protein LOC129602943 [Betta splendens]
MLEEEDGDDEGVQTTGVDRNSYILYPTRTLRLTGEFELLKCCDLQLEVRVSLSVFWTRRTDSGPGASRVPPPVFIPTRILEERNISNTSVNVDQATETSLESALKEKSSSSCVVPRQNPRDKTCSDAPSRQLHLPAVSRVTDTSPTAASQDGVSRRSSGDETLALSFVPTVSPSTTATACDLITCPAAVEEERAGGSETRVQADPGSVDVQESVSLQQCECVTVDLRQTVRRAVHLYQQLGRSTQVTEQRQMLSVLQEAFDDVSAELKSVLQEHGPNNGSASTGRRGDDER